MIINFELDENGNFLNPLASQLEKIINKTYIDFRTEHGVDVAVREFRNWLQDNMPCKIIVSDEDTPHYNNKYVFEIEVSEVDYTMFLLKYSEPNEKS